MQVTFNSAMASCGAGHWATALRLLGASIKAAVAQSLGTEQTNAVHDNVMRFSCKLMMLWFLKNGSKGGENS